ncbi:MAG: flagellar basal body-associated FliL family protein [Pseudomonadota bacterium]
MAEEEIEKNEETTDDISGEEAEEESGGFGFKKIIIFVILPLLIIGGGVGTAYVMGYLDSVLGIEVNCEEVEGEDHPDYEECKEEIEAAAGKEGLSPGVYYDLPDIRVNLNTEGSRQKFLFLVIKLEVPDQENLTKIEQYVPRITDHFQTYLRELRMEDLQGSAGIYRLRLELLERVNAAAPEVEVRDVLFQEMLVQ